VEASQLFTSVNDGNQLLTPEIADGEEMAVSQCRDLVSETIFLQHFEGIFPRIISWVNG
jgi:hypothetical protein